MVTESFDPLAVLLEEPDPELRSRAFVQLGQAARREERTVEAIRYFQQAVEVHPQARAAWRELWELGASPVPLSRAARSSQSVLGRLVATVRRR